MLSVFPVRHVPPSDFAACRGPGNGVCNLAPVKNTKKPPAYSSWSEECTDLFLVTPEKVGNSKRRGKVSSCSPEKYPISTTNLRWYTLQPNKGLCGFIKLLEFRPSQF